ncbi:MAG: hypothetical protein WCT20_04720 [Candidatus Babeliales bacterium]|jgi:hypothetical protein
MKKILSLALCLAVAGAGMQQANAKITTADVLNAKVGTSVAVGLAAAIGGMYAQYVYTLDEGTEATLGGFIGYLMTIGHAVEALIIGGVVGRGFFVYNQSSCDENKEHCLPGEAIFLSEAEYKAAFPGCLLPGESTAFIVEGEDGYQAMKNANVIDRRMTVKRRLLLVNDHVATMVDQQAAQKEAKAILESVGNHKITVTNSAFYSSHSS